MLLGACWPTSDAHTVRRNRRPSSGCCTLLQSETRACSGCCAGVLQGFPIVFNHMSPSKMMTSLKAAKIAREIMEARGDHVRMAVMVRIHKCGGG